ncbi:transcriptional regulator [Parenemella sanctibonifatiensis]
MPPLESDIDPLLHSPIRLRVCAILEGLQRCSFLELRTRIGVSDSVLSKHLSKLEVAGVVELNGRRGSGSGVVVSLTREGRGRWRTYLVQLSEALAGDS